MLVFEAELSFEMKIPEIVLRTGGRAETGMSPGRAPGMLDFDNKYFYLIFRIILSSLPL